MAEPVLPWWRKAIPTGPAAGETARGLGVVILGLAALLFVIRPMMQRAFAQTLPPAVALPATLEGRAPTVSDIEGALAATEELPLSPPRQTDGRLPALSKRLSKVAEAEPEQVAKLMRTWLTEGDS
jgi:flagellar biosynthesis/type III secretory pathway M-ring protein FliF/YscJ